MSKTYRVARIIKKYKSTPKIRALNLKAANAKSIRILALRVSFTRPNT